MKRNWGLPTKGERAAFRDAKNEKPLLTLFVTAIFGVIGAAIAAISFSDARTLLVGLFHGGTLIAAIVAAGFGCWGYVWLARPRFAAQFSGAGDAFSDLLRFYVRAAIALFLVLIIARGAGLVAANFVSVMLLCVSGGAAAAAAFQTVVAFVPNYAEDGPNGPAV